LYAVPGWREAPFFSERERTALEWTEALTLVHQSHISNELYERARHHFSEAELTALTWSLVVINGWNRIAIAFQPEVGSYQSSKTP
ncbi:MAG: carboxymuconolactone decarboxylase family protein, partial [Terriglobia bacterium]